MKNLIFIAFTFLVFVTSYTQCNTNTSICTPGVAGPFNFINASANPSSCLDFQVAGPNYAYIILYITTGGDLNLLLDGDQTSGFLDVSIFDITNAADPCTALSTGTEIGCNYASSPSGCNEFGTSFPCTSEVPAPVVAAGDVVMILVEDWSDIMTSFTLELSTTPGSAQTGPPDPTITAVPPLCMMDAPIQLTAVDMGGVWSGAGVSSTGLFNPALAGPGTFTIDYTIGSAPCDAAAQTTITVNPEPTADAGPDLTVCLGSSIIIGADPVFNVDGASYSWNNNGSSGTINLSGINPDNGQESVNPTVVTTYELTINDNGCVATDQVTVAVDSPPTASNLPPISVECLSDVPVQDVTQVTDESDDLTNFPLVAYVGDVSDGLTCPETIIRTYSVTDDCGHYIYVTQTILINDITAPTASNLTQVNVACTADIPAVNILNVTDEADN
ncbi:MAG: hypothetical protein P8H33_01145, partial [Crocinitomicaceae bacterium]|nr:hypothetical protein [Crocinitomicaceae bacterium]